MNKKALLEFIKKHKIAVISTFGDKYPESSVVDFVANDQFEIIFNTFVGSRKYKNIFTNDSRHVSFVIGWENLETVQYEGQALEVDNESLNEILEEHSKNFEYIRNWKVDEMRWFRVIPKWIKYSDYNKKPPKIEEFSF